MAPNKSKDPVLAHPLPHNLLAEKTLLGAVIQNNDALAIAMEQLTPEDFFLSEHVHIFSHMVELHEASIPIDSVTLADHMNRNRDLEVAGGHAYISQLGDGIPRAMNVEHYARIIKNMAILRRVIHATEAIQAQAFEAGEDAEEVLGRARTLLGNLSRDPSAGLMDIKKIVHDSFARLEKIFTEGRRITGLPTGYFLLDGQLSGLQPGELIIIGARPSQGKTSMALNIIENVIKTPTAPVAMFSLEMGREALLMRLLAAKTRIDAHKFRTGHLHRDDWAKITDALGQFSESSLWIDDSSSSTAAQIASRAERLKREKGLSLVVVDYLQLVAPASSHRGGSRQEDVSSISRAFKAMAKDLGVPVIALSQLTRAPEQDGRRPQLSDLRESGAIEQDADVVLFIHRPHLFKKGDISEEDRAKTEIIIAKQRNGPIGNINFVFLSRHTRFEEAAPDMWTNTEREDA